MVVYQSTSLYFLFSPRFLGFVRSFTCTGPDPVRSSHDKSRISLSTSIPKSKISFATLTNSAYPDVLGVNDILTLIAVLFFVLIDSLVISKYEVNDDLLDCSFAVAEGLLLICD